MSWYNRRKKEICPRSTIRKATVHDAAQLGIIHVASWKASYNAFLSESYLASLSVQERQKFWQEKLEEQSGGDHITFVAINEQSSSIIGFASAGKPRELLENYSSELYGIYVLSDFQRCGVGKKLLKHLVEWLLEGHHSSLFLWVLEKNPARVFYEQLGAQYLKKTKDVSFDGQKFIEVAYGWPDLSVLKNRLTG